MIKLSAGKDEAISNKIPKNYINLPKKFLETQLPIKPGGQFAPLKYIEESLIHVEEPLIEIQTKDEKDFEIKGKAMESFSDGHIDS